MFPNNGAMPSMGVPVKKRRNRKKKPVVLDPEAERQERELRMKIKQSLHTQQVLRTEVEEDEAERTSANVANDAMRGGIIFGHQAHAQAMGSQMNNMMMGGGMSMGFANMQPQMGGMGMRQQQQQQQYQFDNRNQQYGYHQNQEGSGIEKIIPNMQQQIQQVQQQLEIQRQQLEGQAKVKQQMEMEQQRKMNQQMILQQQQIQEHQHQQQIQKFQPQPSLSPQPQSSFSPQPQRQQAQSQLDYLSGNQEFEAKLSSEDIMRRLKYEQERLLKQAQKRANANNIDNSAEISSAISPSPPYVPAQCQQKSNFRRLQEVSGQSSQQPQLDSVPLCTFINEQDHPKNSPQFPAQSKNSPQQNQQQQQHQQFYPHQDGMAHGNFTNQQVKNQTQFPPYDVQIQAQQSEPYPIQKGAPHNQQHNGKHTHNTIHFEERTMSAQLSPQLQRWKSGQETLEKSLFSAGANAESWLKATGSVNTSDRNNSSFSSMAFHSMGNMSSMSNMSASFSSHAGAGAVGAPGASPDSVEEMEGSPNLGGGSKGNEANSKESTDDGNTSGGTQAAAGQSDRGNDEEADSTCMNKGSPHIDTTVPTQLIALQPIQENETNENGGKNLFGQSSLMMSMMDGEFVQSALSMYGVNSDLGMSVDSTTLNALMKQSQTGEISLIDYERRKSSSSSSENNQASSPGNTTAENGKQDVSNSNGNRSLSSGSSVISSVSMEDNQPKESSTNNGDGSVHSRLSGRGGRAAAPRFDMMKEISQWTLNNPFDEDDDSGDIDDGALAAPPSAEGRVSNEGQGHGNVQRGNDFDVGGFHSLGGSIDTMNLSMMSSMSEINMPSSLRLDNSMSESLKTLNFSDRETGERKG